MPLRYPNHAENNRSHGDDRIDSSSGGGGDVEEAASSAANGSVGGGGAMTSASTSSVRRSPAQSPSRAAESPPAAAPARAIDDPRTSATLDAILLESRLASLRSCDDNLLTYDPTSFLRTALSPRGRNVEMIALPLMALSLWGIIWIAVLDYAGGMGANNNVRSTIASLDDLIQPLLVPVSFLLVFRLGRAAVRFWDARAAVGKLVEVCRTLMSTAAVGCAYDSSCDPALACVVDDIARWLCVLPIAVKNFLRPSSSALLRKDDLSRWWWRRRRQRRRESTLSPSRRCAKRRFEIAPLLSDEDAEEVLGEKFCAGDEGSSRGNAGDNYGPILVLNRLRELAFRVTTQHETNDVLEVEKRGTLGAVGSWTPHFSAAASMRGTMLYRQLNEQIDTLTGAWGAMERINATPLPLVYVIHLRTFLMLYLMLWQMVAAASYGWVAVPTLFLASWGLLGIEAAAVECERPFRWHSNHLALGRMCVVVSRNVAQTLRNVRRRSLAPGGRQGGER